MSMWAGSHRVARPGIVRVLDSDDPLVVLAGPLGSGRSTLLRKWDAHLRTTGESVTWADTLPVPEPSTGPSRYVVVEDVDHRDAGFWGEVDHLLRTRPDIRIRMTCHSAAAVPPELGATVVDDLRFTDAEVAEHAAATDSPADSRLIAAWARGHVGTVAHLCACGVETAEQFAALLGRRRPARGLSGAESILALPEFLSPGVVEALGLPADRLDELERSGLGQWIQVGSRPVFVLVPQVRRSTLASLDAATTRRTSEVRRRCAEVLLAEGATFPAFVEGIRSGSLGVADAAVRDGDLLTRPEHHHEITELLRTLSARQLSRFPVLTFELACALGARGTGRLRTLEYFAITAVGARLAPRRSAGERALLTSIESAALRLTSSGDAGLGAARRATKLLTSLTPEDREELGSLETRVYTHPAMTLLSHGRFDEAAALFTNALGSSRRSTELVALSGLATVEVLRGDMGRVRTWVAAADELPGRRGTSRHEGLLSLARTLLALEDGDVDLARSTLDGVWPHVEVLEHWPWVAQARALTRVAQGEGADALEEFRALRHRRTQQVTPSTATRERLDLTEVMLLVVTGDARGARAVVRRAPRGNLTSICEIVVGMVEDDVERMAVAVGRMRPHTPLERFFEASARAVLLRRKGRHDEWAAVLDEVRVLHDSYGLRSPVMFLPDEERTALGSSVARLPGVLPTARRVPSLTPRELVVLRQLVHTGDVEEIAEALHVSPNTVKSQRRSLYRKLGSSSRLEALALSAAHGLLDT